MTSSQTIGFIASMDYYGVSDSNEKVFVFVESMRNC